jgi:hypothetical protein
MERTLPLRVGIVDGEALDSWLEHLARRNNLAVRRLLPVLGLPTAAVAGHDALVRRTPPPLLRRMERQAGLDPGRLDAAVLEAYSHLGWEPLHGSRYCPACLDQSGGRWPRTWRLPWVFTCTTHDVLLADLCGGCGRLPRDQLSAAAGRHAPGTCPNLRERDHTCGHDLTAAPVVSLNADSPFLAAQHWIDARLAEAVADPRARVDDLRDLQAMATWIRRRTTVEDYTEHGPAAVEAFTAFMRTRRDGRRPFEHQFTHPLLVAPVLTRAVTLLRTTDPAATLQLLRPLLCDPGHHHPDPGHHHPVTVSEHTWRTLTPGLRTRLLHAVDAELPPLERLRYRSVAPAARLPDPHEGPAPERARWIPQLLWPSWSVRLTPPHARAHQSDAFRNALATALLLPGHPQRQLRDVDADLRSRDPALALTLATVTLGRLQAAGHHDVLTALVRLADYLDEYGAPIDYQRRRALGLDGVLPADQWQALALHAGEHPGQQRRHLDASRYLSALLTGNDLRTTSGRLGVRSAADRSTHLAFVASITPALRAGLHDHAAAYLHDLGIDEPLTWAPPDRLADGLDLPGHDPDDIDLDALAHLVLLRQATPEAAADELGTTIDHVRVALERLDPPSRQWGVNAAPASWRLRQHAHQTLTAEFFEREYVQAGRTLRQLAVQTGFHRKMISEHARDLGIELRERRRLPTPIPADWLREQYLDRMRSTTDIATELGVAAMTVTRAAHRYGIPVRPAGVHARPELNTTLDPRHYPRDVRAAVEGQLHGWLRLQRFQQASRYPSVGAAARDLGLSPGVLVTQIHRLEHDIGATLLIRATSGQPQQPTPPGLALLDALRQPTVRAHLTSTTAEENDKYVRHNR